ncbi:hypothetical protein [Actinopolymorpha pittospori]|uniref:Uncharacterized protein n=1 Tax=Actinopolymorpha pittospori TaxID=648752 RepID=A0A927MNP3_9ACTN|nr:hypothetical protein [Actinopolymorpha pittospori]MBE1603239.1 hypothetical protein [Actinopolymorpha pittospori]
MEPWWPRRALLRDALSHHDPRRWTTIRPGQRRQSESQQTAGDTFAYHDLDVDATRRSDTHPDQIDHRHAAYHDGSDHASHDRSDHWSHADAVTQQDTRPAGPFPEA